MAYSGSGRDIPLTAYNDISQTQAQSNTFSKSFSLTVDVKNDPPAEDVYENQYQSYPKPLGEWSRSHWVSFSVDFIFVGFSVLFLGKFK